MQRKVSMKSILDYIRETGSTWRPINEGEVLADDSTIVKRVCNNHFFVTHPYFFTKERECARILLSKIKHINVDKKLIDCFIKEYEDKEKVCLDSKQKEGVYMICSENFSVLIGGPGTGKTFVLKCATYCLKKLHPNATMCFLAPTGKAAHRISESIGEEASTIQKKIRDCEGNNFLSYIAEDYLFIDEGSMLDLDVFSKMLNCVLGLTKICLLGDIEQLPAVGQGAILRDIIDSYQVPVCQLEKTFRQDNSSCLYENIQIIKHGGHIPLKEGNDFKVFRTEDDVFELAVERYLENCQKYGIKQTILLSPYRKAGKFNSERLNDAIQNKINPEGKPLTAEVNRDGSARTITFRVGDPVVHLKNINGLTNGDTGLVTDIRDEIVYVDYNGDIYEYDSRDGALDILDLAYAISVNKAQGSEYKCVITAFLREHRNLSKNSIYTAVTRAKERCEVIGTDEVIREACKIQSAWARYTFFSEELEIAQKTTEIIAEIV